MNQVTAAISGSVLRASRKYFSANHAWYRVVENATTTSTTTAAAAASAARPEPPAWTVQIGLTERGLDDMGDITKVSLLTAAAVKNAQQQQQQPPPSSSVPNPLVQAGENVIQLEWEGFSRTDSDELYHAVWNSIEGTKLIPSPVTGQLLMKFSQNDYNQTTTTTSTSATASNNNMDVDIDVEIDEDTVLAEIACDEKELLRVQSAGEWMDQVQYERLMKEIGPGQFAEQQQ